MGCLAHKKHIIDKVYEMRGSFEVAKIDHVAYGHGDTHYLVHYLDGNQDAIEKIELQSGNYQHIDIIKTKPKLELSEEQYQMMASGYEAMASINLEEAENETFVHNSGNYNDDGLFEGGSEPLWETSRRINESYE